MAGKNLTITDIARTAGVSKTTVSRYLNGKYEYMSPETRERIRNVIDLTGYHPNSIARSLKSQKSMLIGLIIADIESPFSSAAVKSIGDALRTTGYNIITANCDNSYQREKEYLRSLMNQQVDGLIVNTTTRHNSTLISLANDGMPIVLIDRFINDYTLDIAYFQNRRPMFEVMEHLHAQGYGRIALFVQPYEEISPRGLRRDAFVERMAAFGVDDPQKQVFVVDLSDRQSVRQQVKALCEISAGDAAPPAIIATNGVTLMHVAQAVLSLGLSMPHEIGLAGYDDWGWASELGWAGMIGVGLTALTPSVHELGALTASMLLDRMRGQNVPKRVCGVEAPMIVRGSTAHGGPPQAFHG